MMDYELEHLQAHCSDCFWQGFRIGVGTVFLIIAILFAIWSCAT